MSDEDDTTTNAPQHRADAPVDGGTTPDAATGATSTGSGATATDSPATDSEAQERETVAERPEHGIGDLNADLAHPFDQTNGIVEGLEGDSDEADDAQDSETQGG